MTRRVIFPPVEFWTQPKENHMTDNTAGDKRRAIALVCHHGNNNIDGVNTILREAGDANRAVELITTLLDAHQDAVPQLVTEVGMACTSDFVLGMANQSGNADMRRAATLIAHHGNNNIDAMNEIFAEASEQPTELIMSVLSLYTTICPMLYTPMGLRLLQPAAARWAGQEDAE